jgi:hypothetical protein
MIDAQTSINHENDPEEGAIAICRCGHIMGFDAHLKFRPLTDQEVISIAGNPEVVKIQNGIAAFKRDKALKDELFPIFEEKFNKKNFHPKVNLIQGSQLEWLKYCATADTLPTHAGYGATMEEAVRALMRSYVNEMIENAATKYQQRK